MLAAALLLTACGSSESSPEPAVRWPGMPVSSTDVPAAAAVPRRARLLAPATSSFGSLSERALLRVPERPRRAWARLLRRLDRRYPRRFIDRSNCAVEPVEVLTCSVALTGRLRNGNYEHFSASLRRVPDDVSGGYLLEVRGGRARRFPDRDFLSDTLQPSWPSRFPPAGRRRPPRVGEPLSPSREPDRYTLLPGSELVAIHGTGNITGGFNALLRVLPGHDPFDVAHAYARQAAQADGPIAVRRHGNTISIIPPHEYGGYAGWIALLDQPGDSRDLVAYDLLTD